MGICAPLYPEQRGFNGVVGGPPSSLFVPAPSGAHGLTLGSIHDKMYTNTLRTARRSAWRVLASTAQWQVAFLGSYLYENSGSNYRYILFDSFKGSKGSW